MISTGSKIIEKLKRDKCYPFFVCIFCKHYMTDNELDLDLHLYENHKTKLIGLPIGRGSLNLRISYAINQGKMLGEVLKYATKENQQKLGWSL
jgi:hypothetical protein